MPYRKNSPEWSQREDLHGWVRGDEAIDPEVTNELARLSRENHDLRSKISESEESFCGLTFDEMSALLRQDKVDITRYSAVSYVLAGVLAIGGIANTDMNIPILSTLIQHSGDVFEYSHDCLSLHTVKEEIDQAFAIDASQLQLKLIHRLISPGLVQAREADLDVIYKLTDDGRRYRNRLLTVGDRQTRRTVFWRAGLPGVPSANTPRTPE